MYITFTPKPVHADDKENLQINVSYELRRKNSLIKDWQTKPNIVKKHTRYIYFSFCLFICAYNVSHIIKVCIFFREIYCVFSLENPLIYLISLTDKRKKPV